MRGIARETLNVSNGVIRRDAPRVTQFANGTSIPFPGLSATSGASRRFFARRARLCPSGCDGVPLSRLASLIRTRCAAPTGDNWMSDWLVNAIGIAFYGVCAVVLLIWVIVPDLLRCFALGVC